MTGESAFCPKTGAQFSKEPYYDENGHVLRAPVEDDYVSGADLDGELTRLLYDRHKDRKQTRQYLHHHLPLRPADIR